MECDKKMFEKYIMIKDTKIHVKQRSDGIWLCQDLPADNVADVDRLIGELNIILNKYNIKEDAKVKMK